MFLYFTCVVLVIAAVANNANASCSNDNSTFDKSYQNLQTFNATIDVPACHTFIRTVNISHNNVSGLTNLSFDGLWNVEMLDLSFNNIESIPPGMIAKIRNMKQINLTHNNLVTLPHDFFYNKLDIETVDLSWNKITHIPLNVTWDYRIAKIRLIDLSYNLLTAFEPWIYTNLDEMDPSYTRLPRVLNLTHNNISTFTNDYNWTYDTISAYHEVRIEINYFPEIV